MGIHYWFDSLLIMGIFFLLLVDVYLTLLRIYRINKLIKEFREEKENTTKRLMDIIKENQDIGIEITDEVAEPENATEV